MRIKKVCDASKTLAVEIPLTSVTGKIRIKTRKSRFEYGAPFAARQTPFSPDNYVEWQIGYSIAATGKNAEKCLALTTLPDKRFQPHKGAHKALYELSEYLYYFVRWGIISKKTLQALSAQLAALPATALLENNPHCKIKRTAPVVQSINGVEFSALTVAYPLLIHQFGTDDIIAEIIIKEKQRAVGTQPMLYICFPISALQESENLLGRTAAAKECATLILHRTHGTALLKVTEIFGMLSCAHNLDITQIISTILNLN